ncbi:hypothetical protein [Vreelandella sp. EE27]
MTTYSDSELEYFADRFVRLRLSRHGFNLAQYLANPVTAERAALEPEPLLPAQQKAVLKIWQRWDTGLAPTAPEETPTEPVEYAAWEELLIGLGNNQAIRQRNGAYVEPLHHHRHEPRNRHTANFARKGAQG